MNSYYCISLGSAKLSESKSLQKARYVSKLSGLWYLISKQQLPQVTVSLYHHVHLFQITVLKVITYETKCYHRRKQRKTCWQ